MSFQTVTNVKDQKISSVDTLKQRITEKTCN